MTLMYGQRIVIPKALQAETFQKIYTKVTKAHKMPPQSSVWWLGLSKNSQAMCSNVQNVPELLNRSDKPSLHCKNCGVLCPPNEQHTIGVISHRPQKVCLAHFIWCARSYHSITHHIWCVKVWYAIGVLSHLMV